MKRHSVLKFLGLTITYFKNKVRAQGKAWLGEKAKHTRIVCEHFEALHNVAMDTKIVFEIGSKCN